MPHCLIYDRPQDKVVSLGGTGLATLQKGPINNWRHLRVSFLFGSQEEPGSQQDPGGTKRFIFLCFYLFPLGFQWSDGVGICVIKQNGKSHL